jgi:hypothetical protein
MGSQTTHVSASIFKVLDIKAKLQIVLVRIGFILSNIIQMMSMPLLQPSTTSPTPTPPLLEHLDPLVLKMYMGLYPVRGQTSGDLVFRLASK